MSTDAVRAALAELVAATNPDGETSVADWRKAWAAARAALSEPVPAPAVDERIADSDSVDLAAASNGSPGGAAVVLHMTAVEAEAVHHALYLRLRALSMTEDHNPDPHRRREAVRVGDVVLRVADRLKELLP